MEIWDISREFFSAPPYDGDPAPVKRRVQNIEEGDVCTLSAYTAVAHCATHADAPLHYVHGGADIAALTLDAFVGGCAVVCKSGEITGEEAERMLRSITEKRILIKGGGQSYLSQSAAFVFADEGIRLVGIDAPSIARPGNDPKPHKELLSAGIPILENLDLSRVEEGSYFLAAAPVKMAGMEGAPVRALLLRGISVYE